MSLPLERWSWGSLSVSVAAVEEASMKQAYLEYAQEHPEELSKLNALKVVSDKISKDRRGKSMKEVREVDRWRWILDGEKHSK